MNKELKQVLTEELEERRRAKSKGLKTDPRLNESFSQIQKEITFEPTPKDCIHIYDYAKRMLNKYGIGMRFVMGVYFLGRIEERKEKRKKA